jgi:branched-chain amino acid aminotransferase
MDSMTTEPSFPYEIRNGRLVPSDTPFTDSSNRALRYGDGIFETFCVRNNTILFYRDHVQRLEKSMEMLHLPFLHEINTDSLLQFSHSLLQRNKVKSGRMRLIVYRKASGNFQPAQSKASWLLSLTGTVNDFYELNTTGWQAGLFTDIRKPPGTFSSLKTLNCLPYIMAGIAAKNAGYDDMFLENTEGHIIEATSSNIFLRKGNQVITPPLSDGCLDGIMRKQILSILQRNNQDVVEMSVSLKFLKEVDEIFLTNVINGVRWVSAFAGREYENKLSVKLVEWLNASLV